MEQPTIRKEPTSRILDLQEALTKLGEKPPPINIIFTQFDPDALGAALGLSFILTEMMKHLNGKDPVVKIYFCGYIGNAQNRVLRDHVGDKLHPIEEFDFMDKDKGRIFFVDSSSLKDSRLPLKVTDQESQIFGIIDHHKSDNSQSGDKTRFINIDTEVRSSCTLVAELLMDMDHPINKVPQMITTLLFIGILNDTDELAIALERDRVVYGQLAGSIDQRLYREYKKVTLSQPHFDYLQVALINRQLSNNRLVTGVGSVDVDHGDDLSLIADYLFKMEGVNLVIVWGFVKGKLRITARTKNSSKLHRLLTAHFGSESGTKEGQGGALLKLDFPEWSLPENEEEKEAFTGYFLLKIKNIAFSSDSDD